MIERGPPRSGHTAFWAAGDLFDVEAVADLCREARIARPYKDLGAAADLLAVAAGQIMDPGSVADRPAVVRDWARRVLRGAEVLRDELGRSLAAQRQSQRHLSWAAVGAADTDMRAAVSLMLAAERVVAPPDRKQVAATIIEALDRIPAALELLSAAANAVELQAARNVKVGRRQHAHWRSFVADACRAYEAATGRKAGVSRDRAHNQPAGPALRFILSAAKRVRARCQSLPVLAPDYAQDAIAAWSAQRGKWRQKSA